MWVIEIDYLDRITVVAHDREGAAERITGIGKRYLCLETFVGEQTHQIAQDFGVQMDSDIDKSAVLRG